jgi:hypothetical protein
MLKTLRLAIVCAAFAFGLGQPLAQAVEPIKPPFGLAWGEKEERMERLLTAAKATIVERKTVEGREKWDVEGLVQSGLKRTVFYFKSGGLVEVELQYQKDDWEQAKYEEFMGQVRERLDQRFGPGQLIADKTEPTGEIVQRMVKWKWNQNNAAVELNFFSAKRDKQVFRTLSVHYRAE